MAPQLAIVIFIALIPMTMADDNENADPGSVTVAIRDMKRNLNEPMKPIHWKAYYAQTQYSDDMIALGESILLDLLEMALGLEVKVRAFKEIGEANETNVLRNSLIGSLAYNETDIGIKNILKTKQRSKYVDFYWPLGRIHHLAIFRREHALGFQDIVWRKMTVALATLALLLSLVLTITLLALFLGENKSIGDHLENFVAIVCQQGIFNLNYNYKSLSIMTLIGITASMVAYNLYTATMASEIATTSTNIKSFEDLLKHGFILMTTDSGSFLSLEDMKKYNKDFQDFLNDTSCCKILDSPHSFVRHLLFYETSLPYFAILTNAYYGRISKEFDQQHISHLDTLVASYDLEVTHEISFPFSRGCNDTGIYHAAFLKIRESGLLHKVKNCWMPGLDNKRKWSVQFATVSMVQVESVFAIWISGVFLSFIIFAVEILVARKFAFAVSVENPEAPCKICPFCDRNISEDVLR